MHAGQTVTLHFQTGNKVLEKTGEVEFASPVVDAASGLREIRIQFDNTQPPVIQPGIEGRLILPSSTETVEGNESLVSPPQNDFAPSIESIPEPPR